MKSHNLEKEYFDHKVFKQLAELTEFYSSLAISTMRFISQGTKAWLNMDTYVFSSIEGTIESIRDILLKGRINDSYALLRKYYDSTVINVYSNLYLKDHFNHKNFVVSQIDNWRNGTETIPEYRVISKYIKESEQLKPITLLLHQDKKYKSIRDRCNNHTHYNFYHNILSNDNQIYFPGRMKLLDAFSADLDNIFIQHFAYLFYLNDHYMMSEDYIDSLDIGMTPEEGSQYEVAPFIQEMFTNVVNAKRPDIGNVLKKNTEMRLI
jgi:hypothetical protein